MHWTSVVAIGLAAALYSVVVAPALARYRAWKAGPREYIARRNWRGVYVPDLALIRVRRLMWVSVAAVLVIGFGYLFMLTS